MTANRTLRKRKQFDGPRKRPRVLVHSNWQEESLMDAVVSEAGRFNWEIVDHRFLHGKQGAEWRPDGVLFCRWMAEEETLSARRLGCPMVRVGPQGGLSDGDTTPQVSDDRTEIGEIASRHFLERGFRHICCVVQKHPDAWKQVAPLFGSFKRTAEEGEANCLDLVQLPHLDREAETFDVAFGAWLQSVPRPLGLLAYGDIFAGHVVAHCREQGVAVPEEVAVLGLGNKRKFCKLSPVPLSSIDPNPVGQGREAARLLQRLMQGEAPPAEPIRVPPVGVVVRRSTDLFVMADPVVAHGLRFLWEHVDESISVDDAAAAANVSKSTLERRFRKQMGRTVNQELLRKRLERCCELLTSTELSVTDIAPRIGFQSKNYLHRAFRSKYGMSPGEFRMRPAG